MPFYVERAADNQSNVSGKFVQASITAKSLYFLGSVATD